MRPADRAEFPEANLLLKGGGDVQDLAAYRHCGGFVTRWYPSSEERAAIAAGGPVWVSTFGDAFPPMAVTAEYPFEREAGPRPSAEDVDAFLGSLKTDGTTG